MVRAVGAREDAERDHQAPQRRGGKSGEERRGRRALQGGRRRGDRLDAAGVRRLRGERASPLEGSDPEGQHQDRLMDHDIIVVGGGNAALCAALSASEAAKRVLVLERAPEEEAGGNSRFTAGLMRIVYNGVDDLRQLIDLSEDEIARSDFGTYTRSEEHTS